MFLEMQIHSDQLKKNTKVNVILPKERKGEAPKVLWLLHGYSGDYTSWMHQTGIERYAEQNNLAVIMPDGANGWYTDTAYNVNYLSFIAEELPEICYRNLSRLSKDREMNLIGGLSMGGYGAFKAALTYPEKYSACIALSGALDITRKGCSYNLDEWRSIFGFGLESALELEGSRHDLFALVRENCEKGLPLPKIYMWCGQQDKLIEANRWFSKHLSAFGVDHLYEESEGNHNWKCWDLHIQDAIAYVLRDEK